MKIKHVLSLCAVGSLFAGGAFQANGEEVLEILTAYDQAFLASFTVSAEATYPTTPFDRSQGDCTAMVRITGDGRQFAMSCEQKSMDNPRFSPDRVDRSYDSEGNYTLGYTKNLFVFLGSDRWKSRTEQERRSIDAADRILQTERSTPLYDIREVGHHDQKNRIFRFLLPMGRGFSSLLHEVVNVEYEKDGLVKVTAKGIVFSPNNGVWELDIDSKNDYLVRSATFTEEGDGNRSTMRANFESGVVTSDVPVWKEGTFHLGPDYGIQVRTIDLSAKTDDRHLGRVESVVNTVESKSTLLDFSTPDMEGKPLVLRGFEGP